MKQDMELIRKILILLEEKSDGTALTNADVKIDGYTTTEIGYHCRLLEDAGFVTEYEAKYANNSLYCFWVGQLTWEGHEFLNKIRSETLWNKTVSFITQRGLPFALDVVKTVSSSLLQEMLQNL